MCQTIVLETTPEKDVSPFFGVFYLELTKTEERMG